MGGASQEGVGSWIRRKDQKSGSRINTRYQSEFNINCWGQILVTWSPSRCKRFLSESRGLTNIEATPPGLLASAAEADGGEGDVGHIRNLSRQQVVENCASSNFLPTGVTLFSSPALASGDNFSKMLESMGSPPTRIVIESGEEEDEVVVSSRGGYPSESGEESSSWGLLAVEEELPSESPESLICAVTLLERGT